MLLWEHGRTVPHPLQEKCDLDHLAETCSCVTKKLILNHMPGMLSLCYKNKVILAICHECLPRVPKKIRFLPHRRAVIYCLQKLQYIQCMADIEHTCSCKLELSPPCSCRVKKQCYVCIISATTM